MALPALAAVILLGKDAFTVIEKINEEALKRERASLERGIKMLGELNASEVLGQSMWDEAFRNVVLRNRPDWIRENFAIAAEDKHSVQQLVIVDRHGTATFASYVGGTPDPAEVAPLLAAAARPMERARMLYRTARAVGTGFDARQPGSMVEGLYVSDMITVNGHPAMLTVSPFTPDVEDLDTPREPTLLLGVQALSEPLLNRLESLAHIQGIERVDESAGEETDDPMHELRDSSGNVVARVKWDFSSPGYEIFRAALPAIAASLGLIGLMTVFAMVTMRRLTRRVADNEERALYASRHDAATGLANRGWFMQVFEGLIKPAAAKTSYAVMLIDCDYFKSVNDTLGHAAGDAVLVAIAERLKALDERLSIAGRLGGDEFAVVTAPLVHADEAAVLVRGLEVALTAAPVVFEQHIIPVSVSVGAVLADASSGRSIDAWLAKADLALYRAKRDGRGCARIYDPAIDTGAASASSNARNPEGSRNVQQDARAA
jgi:diguanylate cyclase (GGDEF)-like protein